MSSHTRPRPRLRLPLSVFAPPSTTSSTGSGANASSKRTAPKGILDTHVHLWTQVQKDDGTLVWPWELRDETTTATTALAQEHSLDQYMLLSQRGAAYIGGGRREAASTETRSTGCVFVQAEATHDDNDADGSNGGWDGALAEVDAVCRATLDRLERGLEPGVLALVPWAPVQHGRTALQLYFARLRALPSYGSLTSHSHHDSVHRRTIIPAVRYLLETVPSHSVATFFLSPLFIDGLKWLGEEGIAFEMCVDFEKQSGGSETVLDVVEEMMRRTWEGVSTETTDLRTRFMLDHFGKPPLAYAPSTATRDPQPRLTVYLESLFRLALLSPTAPQLLSLKLSGLLNTLEPQLVTDAWAEFRATTANAGAGGAREGTFSKVAAGGRGGDGGEAWKECIRRIRSVVEPAMEAFGHERIVVGSDWPIFRPLLFPPLQSPTVTLVPSSSSSSSSSSPAPAAPPSSAPPSPPTTLADESALADNNDEEEEEEALAWAFEMELYRVVLVQYCGLTCASEPKPKLKPSLNRSQQSQGEGGGDKLDVEQQQRTENEDGNRDGDGALDGVFANYGREFYGLTCM